MAGWGNVFGKIAEWFPGRKEAMQNEIDKLGRENAELQKHDPFTVNDSARYAVNADRIKQLREKVSRIA